MAKPEWGVKRICPNCGARYYDMRKDPPVCPTCGTQYDPEALLKSRRARPAPADDVKKAPVPAHRDPDDVEIVDEAAELEDVVEEAVDDDGLEEAVDAGDDDDVLIEDTSELGEDDMDEVVDLETSGDDDDR